MKLQKILNKENNNLDIFRVIAACMVIYGHAYALSPEIGRSDIISRMIHFDYSGSLAVKIFFFLSGLVVTHSLMEKRNPIKFVISRFFRIWPAFFITVFISAFLLGPLLTTLPLSNYFRSNEVFQYIYKNTIMQLQFTLPGVFTDNPFANAVNGSLWTIPKEIFCYLVLVSLYMVGFFNSKILPIFVFFIILIDTILGNKFLLSWILQNTENNLLLPCFALGAIFSFYKEKININLHLVLGAWVFFWVFKNESYNFFFFYIALFVSILYLSTINLILKLKPKGDISYGIYLWGFPVQQTLVHFFSDYGVRFNQVFGLLIAIGFGFISWHLIEKRCISLGTNISRKFNSNSFLLPQEQKSNLNLEIT